MQRMKQLSVKAFLAPAGADCVDFSTHDSWVVSQLFVLGLQDSSSLRSVCQHCRRCFHFMCNNVMYYSVVCGTLLHFACSVALLARLHSIPGVLPVYASAVPPSGGFCYRHSCRYGEICLRLPSMQTQLHLHSSTCA